MLQDNLRNNSDSVQLARERKCQAVADKWDGLYTKHLKQVSDLIVDGGNVFRCPIISGIVPRGGYFLDGSSNPVSRFQVVARAIGQGSIWSLEKTLNYASKEGLTELSVMSYYPTFHFTRHSGEAEVYPHFHYETKMGEEVHPKSSRSPSFALHFHGAVELYEHGAGFVADRFLSRLHDSLHVRCLDMGLKVFVPELNVLPKMETQSRLVVRW